MSTTTVDNKVAIVTGATTGIGHGASIQLAKAGFKVVLAGRRQDKGQALEEELRKQGLEATFVQTDVTKEEDLKRLFDTTVAKYGALHLLINNAGTGEWVPLDHADAAKHFDIVYDVNVKSIIRSFFFAVPLLAKNGGGLIINISSVMSVLSSPGSAVYSSSKTAVDAITRVAAAEFKDRNIKVFSINPFAFESELTDKASKQIFGEERVEELAAAFNPSGRAGKGSEIGGFVVELFSGQHDGQYESGANIAIDAGKDHYPVAEVPSRIAAARTATPQVKSN
ncbi:Glucose 1-dehydrogenase [Balamuthia mandrillaris]